MLEGTTLLLAAEGQRALQAEARRRTLVRRLPVSDDRPVIDAG